MVQKKFLIMRMLGNDMPNIHNEHQTITNLEFTLKNETAFKNTDKVYLLNRIYDKKKRDTIIALLKRYKTQYVEIPFNMSYFKKLPKLDYSYDDLVKMDRHEYISSLIKHNLYLVNNNKARNYCINYGKKNNYEWTFALDSNSFFTEKDYYNIINNIDKKTQYIEIPQYRLDDVNLKNNVLLTKKNLPYQKEFEPQLAFKNTSKHKFNEKIPYGLSPKAELLNALGSKGIWNNYLDNEIYLNIKTRSFKNANLERKSRIIRLSSHNSNNNCNFNWTNRWYGIYKLVKLIEKKNKI